jgi:hypothetical protein
MDVVCLWFGMLAVLGYVRTYVVKTVVFSQQWRTLSNSKPYFASSDSPAVLQEAFKTRELHGPEVRCHELTLIHVEFHTYSFLCEIQHELK